VEWGRRGGGGGGNRKVSQSVTSAICIYIRHILVSGKSSRKKFSFFAFSLNILSEYLLAKVKFTIILAQIHPKKGKILTFGKEFFFKNTKSQYI
jgi:hypothetical protein